MNLEELRAVQADERGSDSLQPLPDSFYQDAADYLAELRDERQRAADRAADPFSSPEVRRLSDEIETAEEVLEAIYERRVGKVVARASLAAADMPADEDGLTDAEVALFTDLVDRIEANREAVLTALSGEGSLPEPDPSDATGAEPDRTTGPDGAAERDAAPDGEPDRPAAEAAEVAEPGPDTPDSGLDAGTAMGGSGGGTEEFARGDQPDQGAGGRPETDGGPGVVDPEAGGATPDATGGPTPSDGAATDDDGDDPDRLTVRITKDVGEVFGVDERVYDLAAEDVVTLPAPNAEPLIERDAAQLLE